MWYADIVQSRLIYLFYNISYVKIETVYAFVYTVLSLGENNEESIGNRSRSGRTYSSI